MKVSNIGHSNFVQQRVLACRSEPSISFDFAIRKESDTLAISNAPDLQKVYYQLTSTSRNVLERLKEESKITKDEWKSLSLELKNLGVITQTDFDYTRGEFRLIPLGVIEQNGNRIIYENLPGMTEKLISLYNGETVANEKRWISDDWSGDPVEYLESWISSLREWRSYLATQRDLNGAKKYENLLPVTEQINSCQKVVDILKNLIVQK